MERYTKVRNIGKGNMGTCFLAKDNEDGKFYVIKQVDLAKLSKKERQQSLNEAKVLSALRHPNIINFVDSFLAKKSDHLCIVMEFADGGDLCNKVKYQRGVRFAENQIIDWFIQIVLALQHMHRRKILHRDVKTQNIFLNSDNLCKLGDFGISKALSGTYEQTNTFVGTPYYLSPELILERPYDHMSDVWALGIVLYELMALRHPFNANDMKSLMHRILRVQYDPPPLAYSDGLRGIVGKILTKDPSQRIRLNEILELPVIHNRLKQWVEGGIMPPKYIAAMVRNKLFPQTIMQLAGPQLPAIGGTPSGTMNTTTTALPLLPGGTATAGQGNNGNDLFGANRNGKAPLSDILGDIQSNNNHVGAQNNRNNLNNLNNPTAFTPKPPLQGLAPSRVQGGFGMGNGINNSNMVNNSNNYGLGANRAPYATPYLPTPNPRTGHLPPVGGQVNGVVGGQGVASTSALPSINRVQPSLRPLPGNPYPSGNAGGYNAPSALPMATPSNDIQSLLAKAAQERVALRNGRRW